MADLNAELGVVYIVHVLGPDDVLVQPDRATAYRVAHSINAATLTFGDEALNDPLSPTVWAVVRALSPAERLLYDIFTGSEDQEADRG